MNLWRTKIIGKLILSRLPFGYNWWSSIGLFRHGAMDDYSYAWKVMNIHVQVLYKKHFWTGLELGPGDGLLSAFLAPALGAKSLTWVDNGDFAHKDDEKYIHQINQFMAAFPDATLPKITFPQSIEKMLSSVGGSYLTQGLSSLKILESGSYDLIYSQAVLEHVRLDAFQETMRECYRLLSPKGVMSHVVDFKDHLGGKMNNMRFSSNFWEHDWFASRSGFYTNRIRLQEMIAICEDIGFEVVVDDLEHWELLPIKRKQLAQEFINLTDEDLKVSEAHLVMRMK